MPIRGFFSDVRLTRPRAQRLPTALPYVECAVGLPGFGRAAPVTFLVDTGADVTILHPHDSLRLLTIREIRSLPNAQPIGGAGAGADHFPVEGTIFFVHDNQRPQAIELTIHIADPSPEKFEFDSLLGRDALDHFVMHFDQRGRILTLG